MKTSSWIVGGLSVLLLSCGQKEVKENLAAKVNAEPEVSGTAELQSDASSLIENSRLSGQQKSELKALQLDSRQKLKAFNEDSLKLRSILIKDVFAGDYNKSEVRLIQSRIRKIEKKRLALIFETIDKANGIFGRETDAAEKERNFNWLMIGHDGTY